MAEEPDPLEKLDYYTLLQVAEDASSDEVRQAFHRFAAKYHPDRFAGAGAEQAKVDRANQIYRRGAEAYRVLTDYARRKLYDGGLAQGRLRFDPRGELPAEPVSLHKWPIKVKNPIARPFATKAEQLYRAGDWGNAKTNLKLALSKDKGNAQLEALLADVEQKLTGGAPPSPGVPGASGGGGAT
jgi:curved DNA-binding protein CbpA